MIKRILSKIYWWAHKQKMRRHSRKRAKELRGRLYAHTMDMIAMENFPQPVRDKMQAHREWLLEQIAATEAISTGIDNYGA